MMPYIFTAIIGYLLGCSNMAYYLSRYKGVDLRALGSKNLGTSNTLMIMGWKRAAIVFLHDAGKAAAAVLLTKYLLFPGVELIGYVAGVAAVLGHIFPFYLKFKGGKGYASFLGMTLALNWQFGLILLAAVAVIVLITDYIVAGTVMSVLAFPAFTGIVTLDWRPVAIICVATAVILVMHRENYVRIFNKTESRVRKVIFAKKQPV